MPTPAMTPASSRFQRIVFTMRVSCSCTCLNDAPGASLRSGTTDKSKGSLAVKLKRAGWDDAFLIELLTNMR